MTKRARVAPAIASATRVACDKEGNADGGKSNGNEGDGRATVTWVTAMAKVTTGSGSVAYPML